MTTLTGKESIDRERMMQDLPGCVESDWEQRPRPEDVYFAVLHELDLYQEGEDNDISTSADLRAVKRFLKKWGKYCK